MAREFVLWGIPHWGGKPLRITSGTVAHCGREQRVRSNGSWWRGLAIYAAGTEYPADLVRYHNEEN
jgi:hypothetical protein